MPGSPLALVLLIFLVLGSRSRHGRGRRNARCRCGVLVDVARDRTVEIGTGPNRGTWGRSRREGETAGIMWLDDFQSVPGTDTLSSPQLAQPPPLEVAGVRFDDRQNVALAEGQLVGALGDVIVDGFGQDFLCRLRFIIVVFDVHAATTTAA